MPKVISKETREKIIFHRENGKSEKEIAEWLRVSQPTVSRIYNVFLKTQSIESKIHNCGRKPKVTSEMLDKIKDKIHENCDITLLEIIDEFNLDISEGGLSKVFKKANLTLKKKTLHPKDQEREDVVKMREEWKEYQPYLDIKKIHFLDETSVNLGMTRLYGWGTKNERVVDHVPDVRFERMSILSTVNAAGEKYPFVYSGTLNGDLFRQYIEFVLVPVLHPGDIVVMDNLSVHKVKGITEAIEAVGANVLYLPPYSPDLNPIEPSWNEIRQI